MLGNSLGPAQSWSQLKLDNRLVGSTYMSQFFFTLLLEKGSKGIERNRRCEREDGAKLHFWKIGRVESANHQVRMPWALEGGLSPNGDKPPLPIQICLDLCLQFSSCKFKWIQESALRSGREIEYQRHHCPLPGLDLPWGAVIWKYSDAMISVL